MDPSPAPCPTWKPDPAWADPLIALLAVLGLFLAGLVIARRQSPPPAPMAGIQGRLAELPFAAASTGLAPTALLRTLELPPAAQASLGAWDRALLGVLIADRGDVEGGRRLAFASELPGPGAAFSRCWDAAFGEGALPFHGDRALVRTALGEGWAAAVLEARLDGREGRDPGPALEAARRHALRKLALAAAAGLLGVLGALAGIVFGIVLLLARPALPPGLPGPPPLDGRALALVGLAWFLGLLLAGTVAGALRSLFPALGPFGLPLAYALHCAWGLFLLSRAQRMTVAALWSSLGPGRPGAASLWGLGYILLAIPVVLALGLLFGPLLKHLPNPQNELLQGLAALRSALAVAVTGLVIAGLAPAFEELLFRGSLLPWMARRWGWTGGLLGSALVFGAMHLQLGGLPTLSALGVMLGLAFRRGGLWAAVLGHALWNGSIFLFLRLVVA